MAIDIVELPSYKIVIFHSFLVCLPEGRWGYKPTKLMGNSSLIPFQPPFLSVKSRVSSWLHDIWKTHHLEIFSQRLSTSVFNMFVKYIHIYIYIYPIGSMYAIYGNIYHLYTPNVSIYTIHGSYGYIILYVYPR